MMAREISPAKHTTLKTRPVFSQGIMQRALAELTFPCAARVNGTLWLELPRGVVISIGGGGSGGTVGSLMADIDFSGTDGETYRATRGMQLLIPTI